MTGMTDISRHGGDKKHREYRDEHGIKVKDDALLDPQLVGVVPSQITPTPNLVDDSDDDDGYETGDTGPGMAAKVVQVGFKALFFPLTLAFWTVISLKHLPWLCGKIWWGIKNFRMLPKLIWQFFRWLFSGRLGKVLLVIGTVTGVIWLARRLQASDSRLQEDVSNTNSEARNPKSETRPDARSPKPEGHHKATATAPVSPPQKPSQTAATEPDEPKPRKKLGFGQLGKLAGAFKRSEPVTSQDAASPNDDRHDPFETSPNRWSTKKSVLFAASCLALLIGSVTVAKQVMQKNNDVTQNAPDDDAEHDADHGESESSAPQFEQFSPSVNSNPPVVAAQGWPVPPVTNTGVPGFGSYGNFGGNNTEYQQEPLATPAMVIPPGNEPEMFVDTTPQVNNQSSGFRVEVGDPEEQTVDNPSMITTHSQSGAWDISYTNDYDNRQDNTSETATEVAEYAQPPDSPFAFGDLSTPASPPPSYAGGGFDDTPSAFDAMSAAQLQTPLLAETSTTDFQLTDASHPPAIAGQPESVVPALTPQDDAPSLAEIFNARPSRGTSGNGTTDNSVQSDFNFTNMTATNTMPTNSMPINPMPTNSTSTEFALGGSAPAPTVNVQEDWVATSFTPSQPQSQPVTQPESGFTFAPNESASSVPEPVRTESIAAIPGATTTDSTFGLGSPVASPALSDTTFSDALSSDTFALAQSPQIPMQNPSVSVQPVSVQSAPIQPVNIQSVVSPQPAVASTVIPPSLFSDAGQESINSIVSPQHIAAMPMVSSDTQTNSAASFTAPAVVRADPVAAYTAQPQPNNMGMTQGQVFSQQPASQGSMTQPVSYSQNSVYIVQPGDNIYKIAKQELGSVKRFREIYDLNRDRLPIGQDTLTAGMELLLPNQ